MATILEDNASVSAHSSRINRANGQPNRRGAANIMFVFVMRTNISVLLTILHQCNGAADIKNPWNLIMQAVRSSDSMPRPLCWHNPLGIMRGCHTLHDRRPPFFQILSLLLKALLHSTGVLGFKCPPLKRVWVPSEVASNKNWSLFYSLSLS